MIASVAFAGDGLGGGSKAPPVEVVVTLKGRPLAAFGRTLQAASHRGYLRSLESAQDALAERITSRLPDVRVRWRYRLVADGFAVVLPRSEVGALARIPGVAKVWPNLRYHALRDFAGPEQIGADKLWGPNFETAGNGMKIGIIDDGIDATQPYFDPNGFQYPPGFPKGQTRYTTTKVIVQRTFSPPGATWKYAHVPFDPTQSFHATHVAGIAAGDHGTNIGRTTISGVAPNAWLGNYRALTVPTPNVGLDGNSAELAAAIEAAVADGMNVINLSLGEPEVEPSRDIVVAAIDAAAAAGIVPVVAAGNDFNTLGYGTVSSPANALGAITVAAVDSRDDIAFFSSAGPTTLSLRMKPDVSAPGVAVVSSLPRGQFGPLDGTSMATPHVAGAAALLKERHPSWTVAEIKSALVQSGDPAHSTTRADVFTTREGGGVVDLPRADVPLLFADPSGLSFGRLAPGSTATRTVTLADAGGGAGSWTVTTSIQQGSGQVTVAPAVDVPGPLTITAAGGATSGDVTGFVVLTRGSDIRRIPFWFAVTDPKLASEPTVPLIKPGTYRGTTTGGRSLVDSYRYPTGDVSYPGPERVYRVRVKRGPANFGVAVLSGNAVPHVTFNGAEDHLTGYPGLPLDLNPYRASYSERTPVAGAVLPAPGVYDVVFDTRSPDLAGPFTFRYWVNDVTPPTLRILSTRGRIAVRATDAGAGVDPGSISATLDGRAAHVRLSGATIVVPASRGRHRLELRVSDYQEAKNMEDVGPVLPNTTTLRASLRVG
jgi:Subtilase family